MDFSRYEFVSSYYSGLLGTADKVNDLSRNCLTVSWQFDVNAATELKETWAEVFNDVVGKLGGTVSKFVAPLYDAYEHEGNIHLVFPFFAYSQTLEERKVAVRKLDEQEVRAMLFDLLTGLRDLHAQGLYLGPLQARSVVRVEIPEERFRYMFASPGVSRIALTMKSDSFDEFVDKNTQFCAPEALYDIILDEGTDLYSCAQLAYFALAGVHPLYGQDRFAAQHFYQSGRHLDCGPQGLPGVSAELSDWLERILTFLPQKRVNHVEVALSTLPPVEGQRAPLTMSEIANLTASAKDLQLDSVVPAGTTTILHTTRAGLQSTRSQINSEVAGTLASGQMATLQGTQPGTGTQMLLTGGPPSVALGGAASPSELQLDSAKDSSLMKLMVAASLALLLVAGVFYFVLTGKSSSKEPERELSKAVEVDNDVRDTYKGTFNMTRWKAQADKLSPQLCSIDPVNKGKTRLIDVVGAKEMSYEFIAYCSTSSREAWLIGNRGPGSSEMALKFEQWHTTKHYGVSWYGQVQPQFKRIPTKFDEVVHLTFVFGNKFVELYENGMFVDRMINRGVMEGQKLGLGRCYWPSEARFKGDPFPGDIFGYAIYSKALSPKEVQANYAAAVSN